VLASDEIAALPREQAEQQLSSLLQQVRPGPEMALFGFATVASYVDPPPATTMLGSIRW